MLFAARSRANAFRGRSECSCLSIFLWNQALATVSCTVCRPHLPKVLRAPQLLTCEIQIELSLYTVLCTFCRQLCQINQRPQPRKQRPTSATPGATLPKKNRVLRPRVFSPVNSQVPELLLLSTAPTPELLLLTMWMTWWPNCPWTFVRNSEVFELPLIIHQPYKFGHWTWFLLHFTSHHSRIHSRCEVINTFFRERSEYWQTSFNS